MLKNTRNHTSFVYVCAYVCMQHFAMRKLKALTVTLYCGKGLYFPVFFAAINSTK